ncbi:MAG: hypothetical protein L6V91_10030 [Bacilli bacterium]|nr:MAG: hypothetical protein L6V91_10030 [Bacilli bacterium]
MIMAENNPARLLAWWAIAKKMLVCGLFIDNFVYIDNIKREDILLSDDFLTHLVVL